MQPAMVERTPQAMNKVWWGDKPVTDQKLPHATMTRKGALGMMELLDDKALVREFRKVGANRAFTVYQQVVFATVADRMQELIEEADKG
jgi:hypothetical protein